MFCRCCGVEIGANATSCARCDAPVDRAGRPRAVPLAVPAGYARAVPYGVVSRRSRLVMLLLCWFLGMFGVHRFYAGRIATGAVWLFTFGLLGMGWLYDMVLILCGAFRDDDGRRIARWVE